MIRGTLVILNSGGLPMTVQDVVTDPIDGYITYSCCWMSPDGKLHAEEFYPECVHLASEDPIFQAQRKLQEENLAQQQKQFDFAKTQNLGLVKAAMQNKHRS